MKNKTMARSGGTSENNKYNKKKRNEKQFHPKVWFDKVFLLWFMNYDINNTDKAQLPCSEMVGTIEQCNLVCETGDLHGRYRSFLKYTEFYLKE